MAKTPIYLKLMIGIGMLIILALLYFLKDHPYYLWVRWTGNILLILGIVWMPFTKEIDKKHVNS
ncbi:MULTISPECIES: hypothetical protein [Lysinibacillus]|uniref:hypothetical protein n=1 Tax=Lysinibacillus TaxID=400634 RepID=UPI00214B2CCF|nr:MULTISPECIES: hypothetical protein [Lysinibacillus]UUV26639.1 hypothetical protein NP781_08635 [Lysinibacillus sp. FN11]UYB49523.1 hypothetical protein OCI51_11335 [Lysinibacillus capsici]WDU81495.1 hypothetical protein PSR12_10080 [Lysinibacillus sp. G01H]